ncbi:helix-turn-helix domain-containing protein [Actinoplanes awajinensis]|uniref:helix-turn-helix domain-containing protein n=1 Tax=Actinoplanes awajinensis TaxID=135946 RepID=UPI000A0679F8|nr:helix-turn-helix domain-containing protein [Actinoplanes awajinensis]
MAGGASERLTFYRAAEVGERLGCSKWWVEEQARQRRIPFCWIGGSYRFTEEHIAEIARRFEVQPANPAGAGPAGSRPTSHQGAARLAEVSQPLRARSPRRVRGAATRSTAA